MKRMPALFIGHGSPMLALDHNEMTKTLTELGKRSSRTMAGPKRLPSFPPIVQPRQLRQRRAKTGTDLRYVRVPPSPL